MNNGIYKHWTKKDEKRIVEFLETQGIQKLADELNVNYFALTGKINRLKKTGKYFEIKKELQL